MAMLEAIRKPMACCSEEEMEEEDKEEEKHEQHNEERDREDEGVEEKKRKVYKVLGRLTAQGKTYLVDEEELRRRVKGENMSTNMFRMLIRVGKKDVTPNVLQQPRKAKTKVTIFSTLTEGEAEDIAKGFGMALAKHDTRGGHPSNTATKITAQVISRSMGSQVSVNLTEIYDNDKAVLLNALVSQQGLFGDCMSAFTKLFQTAKKQHPAKLSASTTPAPQKEETEPAAVAQA
ncbi:uncharacterized protein LOC127449879 [Myxocyprinus asiaticus]|uniref:uncharacterized protein LOC127449879 n=1 Tax=Myxocyprinus asiaticus TaxID=70543 RepID=UPI002223DB32|nr:uncharacterized protein LOC127449879 [Myxocyprinus asiaticus]